LYTTLIPNESTWAEIHPLSVYKAEANFIYYHVPEKLSNDQCSAVSECYPEDFRLNLSRFTLSNTDAEILWPSFKNVIDAGSF